MHRQCQHSPAVCRGRLDRESRNENLNVRLFSAEDGTENKALIADGNEGAQDAVDRQSHMEASPQGSKMSSEPSQIPAAYPLN